MPSPKPMTMDDLRAVTDRRQGPRRETEQRLHLARELVQVRARAVVRIYDEATAGGAEVVGHPALRQELAELRIMLGVLADAEAADR